MPSGVSNRPYSSRFGESPVTLPTECFYLDFMQIKNVETKTSDASFCSEESQPSVSTNSPCRSCRTCVHFFYLNSFRSRPIVLLALSSQMFEPIRLLESRVPVTARWKFSVQSFRNMRPGSERRVGDITDGEVLGVILGSDKIGHIVVNNSSPLRRFFGAVLSRR